MGLSVKAAKHDKVRTIDAVSIKESRASVVYSRDPVTLGRYNFSMESVEKVLSAFSEYAKGITAPQAADKLTSGINVYIINDECVEIWMRVSKQNKMLYVSGASDMRYKKMLESVKEKLQAVMSSGADDEKRTG